MIELTDYGFPDTNGEYNDKLPARVTAVHRGLWEVVCAHGTLPAQLKTASYYGVDDAEFPAVGDFVLLQYEPGSTALITETLPRRSKFSRNDFSGHGAGYAKTILEQVVAANFDYVFIMASLNYDFNVKRTERYLVQAWQSGATPVIVLTKADLMEDYSEQLALLGPCAAGVDVVPVSARSGEGLDRLAPYLEKGKTVVFLGSSGVGKSTLVNALAGEELMKVNTIREDDSKGRHTTTHRQMILLPCGAMIIDTPGMRELGLWDADSGMTEAFTDVEELMGRCRFSDCTHGNEPGCAVNAALADGTLGEERWQDYLALRRELSFIENKAAYGRVQAQKFKNITRQIRNGRKHGKFPT